MSDRTKLPAGTRKTPATRKLPAWARKDVEDAIERLLAVLNEADGDPDLEDDDPGGGDVVDEPHDQVEEGNDEPSLGATHATDQNAAWRGCRSWFPGDDLEFDGDTAPSADSEPSLGSIQCGNQTHWAGGNRDDREWDPAEDGIGDSDGLIEQGAGGYGRWAE